MTDSADYRTIITQLATLTEAVSGMVREGTRRDAAFEQERLESHTSRKDLHEKINDVIADVAAVKSDIRMNSSITLQAKVEVGALKALVDKNAAAAQPSIALNEKVQSLGKVVLFLVGGGGIALATTLLVWGEAIRGVVMHWLGMKP